MPFGGRSFRCTHRASLVTGLWRRTCVRPDDLANFRLAVASVLTSFALPGLFNGHSLLEPDCGLGAQPLQRLKVVSENLYDLSQAVGPPCFDNPFPLLPRTTQKKGSPASMPEFSLA